MNSDVAFLIGCVIFSVLLVAGFYYWLQDSADEGRRQNHRLDEIEDPLIYRVDASGKEVPLAVDEIKRLGRKPMTNPEDQ